MKKQSKRVKAKSKTKTKLQVIVAIRDVCGEIAVFSFPSSKLAKEFADEAQNHGCETLLGWGE